MSKKPPTSAFGRLSRLGGLSSRVSTSYLGQRIAGVFQDEEQRKDVLRKLHIENAQRVVETMGQLKGAAMKVGQSLAQVVEGMDLPPEVGAALRKLNDSAEPVPFEVIREDIEKELGAPLDTLFSRVEPTPLGTASLAQAHAAWLPDGAPVVVKVLHRHIERSVASDLGALKAMFISGKLLRRDRAEIDMIFDEIRTRLEEELDYLQEAANIEEFRQVFGPDSGLRIPATHPKFCTRRVLTMDRLPGVPLDAFLESASAEARQQAGLNLSHAFFVQTYEMLALHADPHAGNYLFEPDGTVGLLDFGCVKRFEATWIADYARIAQHGIEGRRAPTMALLRDIGGLCSDDPDAEQALWDFVELLAQPFRVGRFTAGGDDDHLQDQIREIGGRLIRYPEIRAPGDMIYLHRALGGTYAMLRRLKVRADWGEMARPYHAAAVARVLG